MTDQTPPTLADFVAALDYALDVFAYPPVTRAQGKAHSALQSLRDQLPQLIEQAEVGRVAIAALPGAYYMDPPDGGSVTLAEQVQRMCDDAHQNRAFLTQGAALARVDLNATVDRVLIAIEKKGRPWTPHTIVAETIEIVLPATAPAKSEE